MTLDSVRLVEAALFSAGKPMTVDDIVQTTRLKHDEVTAALKRLHAEYEARGTALEVVKSGTKWAMAVRADYTESTKMLAPPEIPRRVLKTLALIAFFQPIKQADLKDMVGSVVYDHVHELHERGMVTARQDGITKILSTTDRFVEYFGIDATQPEDIKTALAKRVGLDPAALLAPKPASPPPQSGGGNAEAAPAEAPPTQEGASTPRVANATL